MIAFLYVMSYSLSIILCGGTSHVSLRNMSLTKWSQCTLYQRELRRCLDDGIAVSVTDFNKLFDAQNYCCWDLLRHPVYLWMIDAGLKPDIQTFNLLIKSLRYTVPIQFQFIKYFRNEMDRFNVTWNTGTIRRILLLYALFPNADNVRSADRVFYCDYMGRQWLRCEGIPPTPYVEPKVAGSYLKVYLAAGDRVGATTFKEWIMTHYGLKWYNKTMALFLKGSHGRNRH